MQLLVQDRALFCSESALPPDIYHASIPAFSQALMDLTSRLQQKEETLAGK